MTHNHELYDRQAELDGVYCDICGNHHHPSCDQLDEPLDDAGEDEDKD